MKPLLAALLSIIILTHNEVKELYPEMGLTYDITEGAEKQWKQDSTRYMELLPYWDTPKFELLSEEDKNLFNKYSETTLNGYLITWEDGCSWYCGGGPYNITSSSELDSTKYINYKARNIHDFDLKTAWVEGKNDYGIGESISYHFKGLSPPVTQVEIYNGYQKSMKLWEANSRVKTLKMLIDGKHFANLHLKDTNTAQIFKFEELQSKSKEKDMIMTFEIAEVYPGNLYKDVAISEIELSGTGVH